MQMNLDYRCSRAKRQLSRRHMLFLYKIQYSGNVILYEEYKFHYILPVDCEHTVLLFFVIVSLKYYNMEANYLFHPLQIMCLNIILS